LASDMGGSSGIICSHIAWKARVRVSKLCHRIMRKTHMLPRRYLPSMASLTALEALERLGTASAAAAELSLTQGAVSRQIQLLEGQLGVPLVTRERQRLVL